MASIFTALFIGLIFGSGIALSGMINPAKVLNFFDFAGTWDPSLGFVMGGALIVTAIGYFFVLKRSKPVFDKKFNLPKRKDIDLKLVAGAGLFGIGWGIAGFCPGGAIPALGLMKSSAVTFVIAMLIGIGLTRFVRSSLNNRISAEETS